MRSSFDNEAMAAIHKEHGPPPTKFEPLFTDQTGLTNGEMLTKIGQQQFLDKLKKAPPTMPPRRRENG